MIELVQTPVKMTPKEILVSAAMTLCLLKLEKANTPECFIEELCSKPQYGLTASASKTPSGQRFVRITDIKEGVVDWDSVPFCECEDPNKYKLTKGDILIARTGSVGKSFLVNNVPELAVFASYLIRIQVNPIILPEYLYWCFQSQQFWRQIMNARRGSAIKNINAKMLQSLRFPCPAKPTQERIVEFVEAFQKRLGGFDIDLPELPPPLDEQRRVVARIEELAAKIEEAQDLRRRAAEEAEALKGEALMKYLDRKGKSTVKDFASIQSGYAFKSEWFSESGMRLVRNVNIGHGKINWDNTARIPETMCSEFSRFKLSEGDILISLDRPIISTGVKVARVSAKDVPSLLLQRVGRVCFHNNLVLPEFFFCWLQSPSFIFAIDPGRSNGVPHISQKDIERIPFTPPTIDEQRRIVARLDVLQAHVDGLKRCQARTAEELDALLPAVLERAFRGKL